MKLFDTYNERHAFVIGFCELLPPWPAYYKGNLPPPKYLKDEQHYYYSGRTFGFFALSAVIFALARAFCGI